MEIIVFELNVLKEFQKLSRIKMVLKMQTINDNDTINVNWIIFGNE